LTQLTRVAARYTRGASDWHECQPERVFGRRTRRPRKKAGTALGVDPPGAFSAVAVDQIIRAIRSLFDYAGHDLASTESDLASAPMLSSSSGGSGSGRLLATSGSTTI